MTYEEISNRLKQCETALTQLQSGNYQSFEGFNVPQVTQQLTALKESLEGKLKVLAEQEKGVVSTDDEDKAEDLAKKGVNVNLTTEDMFEDPAIEDETPSETEKTTGNLGKANAIKDILTDALEQAGNEVTSCTAQAKTDKIFIVDAQYKAGESDTFKFIEAKGQLYLVDGKKPYKLGPITAKESGEPQLGEEQIKSELVKHFTDLNESAKEVDNYGKLKRFVDQLKRKDLSTHQRRELETIVRKHLDKTGSDTQYKPNNPIAESGLHSNYNIAEIIEEAYYEVLMENPIGDVGAPESTVLLDGTDTLIEKFPALKNILVKLMTKDYNSFISNIEWVSPRPTTFRVHTQNGQDFTLQWTGKNFQANILGKNYFLGRVDEFQLALEKLSRLYQEQPVNQEPEAPEGGGDEFGGAAGGGGGDFPGGEGGGEGAEFDAEGGEDAVFGGEGGEGEDLSDDSVSFEDEPVS